MKWIKKTFKSWPLFFVLLIGLVLTGCEGTESREKVDDTVKEFTGQKNVERMQQMKKDLDDLENFDERIEQLEKNLEQKRKELQRDAINLSEKRQEIAGKFEKDLELLMASVGLQNANFKVLQTWQQSDQGIVSMEGKRYGLSDSGLDQIEFNVGLNVGEPVRPLHKVASGGEVSRIMLSIKTLLADSDAISTLVFDEIDSGISGRFAQIVGQKMLDIANHHQLIVITHLPQIAAQGQSQYSVMKNEVDGRTLVNVKKLDINERVSDIAKLLGGAQVTPRAIENAKELLGINQRSSTEKIIEENLNI